MSPSLTINTVRRYTAQFNAQESEDINHCIGEMPQGNHTFRDVVAFMARTCRVKSADPPPVADHSAEILHLQQENNRLILEMQALRDNNADVLEISQENDEITEENERLTNQVRQLQELQQDLHQQIEAMRNAGDLDPKKAFVLTMTPFESHLIVQTCALESKRLGREIDPANLLKQMLLSYYLKGAHDHFPLYFSRRDLKKLAEHYAQAEATNIETPVS